MNHFDANIRIWDIHTGETIHIFDQHSDAVIFGDWSPDGERIVTVSIDDTIRIWNARTGAELLQLAGETLYFSGVTWSPDGQHIAMSLDGEGGFVRRVWQSTEELINYAHDCCVFRDLSAEERQQFGLPER